MMGPLSIFQWENSMFVLQYIIILTPVVYFMYQRLKLEAVDYNYSEQEIS